MADTKKNKTEMLSVRLDPEFKDKFDYVCSKEFRPAALQARKILDEWMKTWESENQDIIKNDPNWPGENND